MIFIQLIFFIVLVYLFLYAPGRYLVRTTKLSYSPCITVLLSLGAGIAVLLLSAYLFAWVKLEWMALVLTGILTVLDRGQSLGELSVFVKKLRNYPLETVLLMSGIIGMCYLTWRSGIEIGGEYYFYGVNSVDSLYHLALIGNLTHTFPPEHFGLSGIPLRGYHFFYDFLIALFAKYFHFQITDLYLRFFPLLVSFLYGVSFIGFSQYFTWKKDVTRGIIFVVFFLSNFEFFFNYFVHSELLVHIPEGLTQILDPSVPFSIALFICGYILFSTKGKTLPQTLLAASVIGILPMIKVYTGFLFFAGLGCVLLWSIVKKEYQRHLLLIIASGIIAGMVYLPVNFGAGSFIFAPFLYWRHLMEGSHFFQELHFPLQYLIFQEHSNFPRMAFIIAVIGGVFFIETLGWRIPAGIIYLLKERKKKIRTDIRSIFWIGVFLAGIFIPILFIQSSSVFNIVQFYWIIVTLSLPFFVFQVQVITAQCHKRYIFLVWTVIVLSTLPSLILLFKEYSSNPTIIPSTTVELTKKISSSVPIDQSILILDTKDKSQVPLFSSLTARSMYLETEGIDFSSMKNVIYDREQKIDKILDVAKNCNDFTKQKDTQEMVSLILSTNSHYFVTSPFSCLENNASFKILFTTPNQQLVHVIK